MLLSIQSIVLSQMEATGYTLLKFIYFRLEFLFQCFLTCQNKFQLFPAIFTPASIIYYSHPSVMVFVLCVVDILRVVADVGVRCVPWEGQL